ncbi:putative ABC-type transport system, ATP-binding protein [Blastococcus saxobsidens DD2]|uniref:Putative ABC-type transport system, ATP-binding protein n=2 Tax=Blastococcus saxobsidens TaxID=138336 RepID=H6RX98_BLASD|nr:putative ABC-type transport system, ATP-binding protein [Blastococcus saxobsidens DD2]
MGDVSNPGAPEGAVVRMTGVDVVRGQDHLLRGVDWSVEADHRWVVLGPNGAGKTTLLQLAAALMHPTRGEVRLLGETLGAVDVFELRPRIGLTSASLAQRISGAERTGDVVVSAGYAVVGRWRERYDVHDLTRAGLLMQQWGVAQYAHRPFGTLSEGERKRTQIARALMPDPELLLLDEPGAGLDLAGREDLVGRLTDLAKYHYAPAQVLVTHHVEEIPPGYTHALLLRDGEVVAAGAADDVLTAATLSDTFGLPLSLARTDGRFTARRAT